MTFEPYNMRALADKIESLIQEAEKTADNSSEKPEPQSLDNLLTTPAGSAKLASEIDKSALVSKLKLTTKDGEDLWNAVENLGKESPVINQENATAILNAFKKLAPKANVSETGIVDAEILTEKYNKNFDDPVSYQYVEKALKEASEFSPMAKDLALKLAVVLTKGSQGRRLDEGLEGILNAVVYAIDIAKHGNRSELLHMLDDFETKYEGDQYAFDQNMWNDLMKNLKNLAKEVLTRQ